MHTFSKVERERYHRHFILPNFSEEGQRKLKAAKVLVVGSGGLGSPVLQYLAAAGVGTLGIVDFDEVEVSNLQRQVLFGLESVGKPKVEEAKKRIESLNPHIELITYHTRLTSANALDIIQGFDIVADGTDNFATRYLVNDACVLLDKVNVYASIFQFSGQVSVFHYTYPDGSKGPNYRDLFPTPPPAGSVPTCAEGGVLGVLPGIMGSMQALEVIKVITGVGEPLAGRLYMFDALSFSGQTLKVFPDPENPLTGDTPTQTGLIDYVQFCGAPHEEQSLTSVPEMSVQAFQQLQKERKTYQLIDVREPEEFAESNIGGELIPVQTLGDALERIRRDCMVVVHCRSGVRSKQAVRQLLLAGFSEVYSLEGGILAYLKETIAPS